MSSFSHFSPPLFCSLPFMTCLLHLSPPSNSTAHLFFSLVFNRKWFEKKHRFDSQKGDVKTEIGILGQNCKAQNRDHLLRVTSN